MYGVYLDEQAHRMTVVSIHPNSTSLERHIKLGAPEVRKLAPYIDLREIEVFGQFSEAAADLVRKEAAALGDGGRISLHEQSAGFGRLCTADDVAAPNCRSALDRRVRTSHPDDVVG
jgi:hypothetical protein